MCVECLWALQGQSLSSKGFSLLGYFGYYSWSTYARYLKLCPYSILQLLFMDGFWSDKKKNFTLLHQSGGGLYPVVNPIFLSLCKSSLKALSLFFCLQSETLIAELRRQETLGHGGYCFSTKMSENWPLKSIFQNNIFYEVGPWDMYVYLRRKESENSNNDTFLWWFETLCYLMHLQIRVQLSVSRIIL